ncbi:hypothetical protein MGALJ_48540 [Mycobacterium gallinarum]|uniref:Uncharacterized protein n=1 Tax=Mycobacterium gallinarum TaxID=39689 RepID=A0A9W4FHH0_9MYCO|nr:hypothetical protein [Mycobacterium gallinarum]BBY95185.1 hypothetical protein MGALJ_48540 [Mycobacterium gallinarum]
MGNPIHVIGDRPRDGYFYLCDDLARTGARELGSDGLVLLAYLLSRAGNAKGGKPFETSSVRISIDLGWGPNRNRVRRALDAAEKQHRLVKRKFVRDGHEQTTRWAYVVAAGGRKFTDWELTECNRPIELPSKMSPEGDS